jgi:hypothetical protein
MPSAAVSGLVVAASSAVPASPAPALQHAVYSANVVTPMSCATDQTRRACLKSVAWPTVMRPDGKGRVRVRSISLSSWTFARAHALLGEPGSTFAHTVPP